MADDASRPAAAPGGDPAADGEAGIGERLRRRREDRKLTAEAAASSLHMDISTLRALEEDDFSRLGAPVFVRGHLRRYAALLGLHADELLATYERNSPPDPLPPRPLQSRERFAVDDGLNWPVVVGVVVVLLLVVLAVWRLWDQPGEPVAVSTDALQLTPGDVLPREAPLVVLPEAALVSGSETPAQPSAGPETPTAEPAAPAVLPAIADQSASDLSMNVVVTLDDECWTEITDARGQRLYFGMGQADQRIAVSGQAPISVLLGNAGAARVEVDGRAWQMPDAEVSNNVARLRIEGVR